MLVDILAIGRRNKGSDDKVNVGEEEEDGDGESGFEGWCPLLWVAMDGEGVEVEVDEGAGYEDVDNGQGVRNYTGRLSIVV
jgi:hypothetical protein